MASHEAPVTAEGSSFAALLITAAVACTPGPRTTPTSTTTPVAPPLDRGRAAQLQAAADHGSYSAGIVATAADVARFAHALFTGSVLDQGMLGELLDFEAARGSPGLPQIDPWAERPTLRGANGLCAREDGAYPGGTSRVVSERRRTGGQPC